MTLIGYPVSMTAPQTAASILKAYQTETGGKITSVAARYRHLQQCHVIAIQGTGGNYEERVAWPELIDVLGELQRMIKE